MKITKFLGIGILSVLSTFQGISYAQEVQKTLNNTELENIQNIFQTSKSNIENTINKHLNTPFFNENTNITVNLVYDESEYNISDNNKLKSISNTQHSYSPIGSNSNTVAGYFYRQNGLCEIKINIGLNGESINLSPYKEVIDMTLPMNDRQRMLAQQFITLHEFSHCNFGAIENPIIIPGATENENNEFSYILKDQFQNHFGDNITYIGLLRENEADISAIYALIREHGINDVDLQFIKDSVLTQRQSNYFHRDKDYHFTHLGLNEALKPENITKMLSIQTNEDMQQHVLTMANIGVLKLAADSPNLSQELFSKDNFMVGFMANFIEILNDNYKKGQASTFWPENTKRGLTYELAQKLFSNLEVKSSTDSERFVESLQYMENQFNFDFGYWDNRKLINAHDKVSNINNYIEKLRIDMQQEISSSSNQFKSQQRFFDIDKARENIQYIRTSHINNKKANLEIG